MTGSSTRNLDSSRNVDDNGRGSPVKGILQTASRRLITNPLHLSVLSPSGTRSEENIPSTNSEETTFVEHASVHTPLLLSKATHTERMRTFSLTMDVSNHNMKDIDSGNSSLIDSSSTNSYQEFGSEGRSVAFSYSKSDQSLMSSNQAEFHIDRINNNRGSLSDNVSGSSGKVSLNASDITGSSEESLISNKNGENGAHSSTFYTHKDDDSTPFEFIHLPMSSTELHLESGRKHKKRLNLRRGSINLVTDDAHRAYDFQAEKSIDSFTSIIIGKPPRKGLRKPSTIVRDQRLVETLKGCSMKYKDLEDEPLLLTYESNCAHKESALMTSANEDWKHPLRRTASTGNISEIHREEFELLQPHKTMDSDNSNSPALRKYLDTQAAFSASSFEHQHNHISNIESSIGFSNQPSYSVMSYYPVKLDDSSTTAHSSQVYSHPPLGQSQHFHESSSMNICLNDCSKALYSFSSHVDNTWTSNVSSEPSRAAVSCYPPFQDEIFNSSYPSDYNDNVHAATTFTTKNPVKNLKSVLGYGTPVPANALKKGVKSSPETSEKPLQVLVPRVKDTNSEEKQLLVGQTIKSKNTRQDKSELDKELSQLYHHHHHHHHHHHPNPELKRLIHPQQNEYNNLSYPELNAQNNHVYPNFSGSEQGQRSVSVKVTNREEYFPRFKNDRIYNDQNETFLHPDYRHIYRSETSDLVSPKSGGDNSKVTLELEDTKLCDIKDSTWPRSGRCGKCEIKGTLVNTAAKSKHDSLKHHLKYSHPGQLHYSTLKLNTVQKSINLDDANKSVQTPDVHTSGDQEINQIPTDNDLINPPIQPGHLRMLSDLENAREDFACDGMDACNGEMDENVYKVGMILPVPKTCFVQGFLESGEDLSSSGRGSFGNSLPSSADSGHVEHNDGSLQSSSVSQFGLLKVNLEEAKIREYTRREIPDYKYLCVVATIMNPALGLAALIFNHYARRNIQLQRRSKANNLYFATIGTSTIAIFLTLIAGTLLIANGIVLRDARPPLLTESAARPCEDSLFGFDEELQEFFDLDALLYCEIIKKQKVMEALKRFWLEDTHNKRKHGQLRAKGIENFATGSSAMVNYTTQKSEKAQINILDSSREAIVKDTAVQKAKRILKGYISYEDNLKNDVTPSAENVTSDSTEESVMPESNTEVSTEPEAQYQGYMNNEQHENVHDELSK